MKSSIAVMALTCTLAALPAAAQGPAPRDAGTPDAGGSGQRPYIPARLPFAPPPDPGAGGPPGSSGTPLYPSTSVLPEPTRPDQLKPATLDLPTDRIEPYLLTKEAGPFMVLARTFRGPDAERYALALVLELQRSYGLPAYILRSKDFPGLSNIRNVPPTALPVQNRSQLTPPEKYRTYDEATVLVGNEKTLAGSLALWRRVKKIHPKCLDQIPTPYHWRQGQGLSKALRTTNPYVPAQDLFPKGRGGDALIKQINGGPHSIFHCRGRYSLQVAEFAGRSTFNPDDPNFQGILSLRRSPLATAAEDAEKLANAMARDPEIKKTGFQPYVYHDRTSSKVTIGSFNSPDDPAAANLRNYLLKIAVDLTDRSHLGTMIVPAPNLMDLEPIKPN
jgi:hypothetical protein